MNSFFKNNDALDLGFGNKTNTSGRLLNRDGSFNIKRTGQPFMAGFSLYHWLIRISWVSFIFTVLGFYFFVNLFYASIYYALGVESSLIGTIAPTVHHKFMEAFFFSAQTLTTVGYGRISPIGFTSNMVAAIEALNGIISFAVITGILYGRFAKPSAKILFSTNAILAPYKDINAFMFRIANGRSNQLVEIEAQLTMSYTLSVKGQSQRKYVLLKLEREKINFFPLPWTVVHAIEPSSPLEDMSLQDLQDADAEFFIVIKAFEDTFSQTVYARGSYKCSEILSGVKFVPNFATDESGDIVLFLDKLNDHIPAPLNTIPKNSDL